ncbi:MULTISPECIES: succinate dehydrogenase, hydrophobic membrane anchor protein [unclassified Sphingomonas]|uniref:succinate dehydrogenase, hydrophobic membrane anchor protein n=1 Tax=unclassified Sphingomonas TaxID=196159 RepID=UPI0008368628|nr:MULTISPECIES: succinate dehydrogenase, hydrophobic membrane anchor protein [unclassified Sphingomonas]MCH4893324.1 succinate dehydrogenase, hydrophobic membrane anchor protein [Sphingomonas sp. SFZ2018-12]
MGNGTSIGRVRGLGPANEGTHHWWHQRLTAGSNLALMAWFLVSIARLPAYDHQTLVTWMASAWVAVPLILLVSSLFYHARLGLQVLIEDYQREESRVVLLVLLNGAALLGWAIAAFAILKIAFSGAATA